MAPCDNIHYAKLCVAMSCNARPHPVMPRHIIPYHISHSIIPHYMQHIKCFPVYGVYYTIQYNIIYCRIILSYPIIPSYHISYLILYHILSHYHPLTTSCHVTSPHTRLGNLQPHHTSSSHTKALHISPYIVIS